MLPADSRINPMVTTRHSFTEPTIAAHCDVVRAVRAMPRLTLVVFGILLLQGVVAFVFHFVIPRTSLLGHHIPTILYYALVTPFLIAVHRFIILGEVTQEYRLKWRDRRYQQFFGWTFVVFLLSLLPALAMNLPKHWTPTLLPAIALVVFIVRSIILFPAIAVDAPGATPRDAFEDTRGHGWYIFFLLWWRSCHPC